MSLFGNKNLKSADKKNMNNERRLMIGENLNFAASEAYKLLRTNIMFSFPQSEEHSCRVIGVTSSFRNEGKSLTSLNTAYSLAMDDKRVLLIECDLRLPTISKKTAIAKSPGLSNALVGLCNISDAIQTYPGNANLKIMCSGDIPPNPSELLGSDRMNKLLAGLRNIYDYIILDLPPVCVADCLVVSKLTDGMLVVVRKDYTDRSALRDTVKQLEFVDSKIMGFVFNYADENRSNYRNKRYYKRYGYKYGYDYK